MDDLELKTEIVNRIIDEKIWATCYICSTPLGNNKEEIIQCTFLHATMNGVALICPYCHKKISVRSNSG